MNSQQSNNERITILHYSYRTQDILGSGFKSQVYMGRDDISNQPVAIKVFDMSKLTNEVETDLLQQEIKALQLLDSVNIVKLFDHACTPQTSYLIFEYCDQGDLGKYISHAGHVSETEAVKIFKHIVNGFKDQIKQGVIHRDLKPINILLHQGIPKIADYGFSKMINAPKSKVYYNVGTTLYMSPQALMNNTYSEKSDVWSIGVMFYQILYGKVPWQAPSEKEFIKTLNTTPLTFPNDIPISAQVKDLIQKCLSIDEDARLSCIQLQNHPLFNMRVNAHIDSMERGRIPQLGSFHVANRGSTNYSQHRILLPQEAIRQRHISVSPRQGRPQFLMQQQVQSNVAHNDKIINSMLCLLKFLLRIAKIIDYFDFFKQHGQREKLLFFIIKHAVYKSNQLKTIIDNNYNPLRLPNYQSYIQGGHYNKFKGEIMIYQQKFRDSFTKLWTRIEAQPMILHSLLADKRFATVFDKSELEVVSFYVFILPVLKKSIIELFNQLNQQINNDDTKEISVQDQAGIVLLDYMVTYFTICQLIINNFDNPINFANQSQIQNIVSTKPNYVNKMALYEIGLRINKLNLNL